MLKLMKLGRTFTWTVDVRVVIDDFVFVFAETADNLLPLYHANCTLSGSRRFHTLDSVSLPDDGWLDKWFESSPYLIARGTVLTVSHKVLGKSIGPCACVGFIEDYGNNIPNMLSCSLLEVALCLSNVGFASDFVFYFIDDHRFAAFPIK